MRSNREQITSFSTRKSYSALTGVYSSEKNNRLIYFESSLERDFAKLLEFDNMVVEYLDHPLTIGYIWKGKDYSYTPDFLVNFDPSKSFKNKKFLGYEISSKQWLVELKPRKFLTSLTELEAAKYEAAKEFCEMQKNDFKIVSEEIRNDYLLNVKKLLPLVNSDVESRFEHAITEFLNKKEVTVHEVLDQFKDDFTLQYLIRNIWIMIAQKKLKCDLSVSITKNTLLSL